MLTPEQVAHKMLVDLEFDSHNMSLSAIDQRLSDIKNFIWKARNDEASNNTQGSA